MSDCNSLETLLTSLTNEVAALKARVARLEGRGNIYATKTELITTKNDLVIRSDKLAIAIAALSFLKVLAGKIGIILSLVQAAGLILRLVGKIEVILSLIGKVEYILRIIEKLLKRKDMEFSTVSVTVFKKCKDDGTPEFGTQSISVIKGLEAERIKEFAEIAKIRAIECKECAAVAAIPQHWQVRVGADRPQLVILFGEDLGDGKTGRSRFPICIPHYNKPKSFTPQIPSFTKGNFMAILVLKDNSRLTVNAISAVEARRVISALSAFISPSMLTGLEPKIGSRGGIPVSEKLVKPTSLRFFATGQKDMNPTWARSV
jgi:hypothetical protein